MNVITRNTVLKFNRQCITIGDSSYYRTIFTAFGDFAKGGSGPSGHQASGGSKDADAGKNLDKTEAANENEYFHKMRNEQLKKLKEKDGKDGKVQKK